MAKAGKEILIGNFLEYDEKNNSNFLRSFIRVRVVRKPLKESKRIKRAGGQATEVHFKFEGLGPFCYLCGLMDHVDKFYGKLLSLTADDASEIGV